MASIPLRLVAALALLAVALPATAQEALPPHAGVHVLAAGPDGTLACDPATEAQVAALEATTARRSGGAPTLTALASLNPEGTSDFRIVLRATDQLLERPEALLAFRRAAARWERILQSDVTTVIDVDYGPNRFGGGAWPTNVLGSTNSALLFAGSTTGAADMRNRMLARASDNGLRQLYQSLPVPTPSTSETGPLNRGIGGLIPLQMLGYQPATIPTSAPFGTVPTIGFNDAFPYDFDPTDGVDSDKTDFEAVAIHEIGHALGFSSAIGISVSGSDPLFTPWDLFRVRPDDVEAGESYTDGAGWETAPRVVTPGPPNTEVLVVEGGQTYYVPVQVFFDGLAEREVSTATGAREGGDGQQASHWRDDALRPPSLGGARRIGIMDPNIGRGGVNTISTADIRMLETIGYAVDYDPAVATVALSVGGQAIDDRFLVRDPVEIGDVPVGSPLEVAVEIGNASASTALTYGLQVSLEDVFPEDAVVSVSLTPTGGVVDPGASTTAQLRLTADRAAIGGGLLRLRTNDADRAVIEVPFAFTADGARAPELVVGALPALGDLGEAESRTETLEISNAGTFPLDYRLLTALVTRSFPFPDPAPGARAAAPLFTADFEGADPLAAFTFADDATPDRWQTRTAGPAALPGHSAPTVLYYGDAGGADQYSDASLGQIETPAIDFSGAAPGRRVTLSFAHYLQAEAGYDFATVLISLDGGDTFEPIATSDGGVLRNTDAWETVVLEVPGLAGLPDPIVFAFRFESDGSVTDLGWYLDDVVVAVSDEEAPFVVTPVAGTLDGGASADLTLSADAALLARGFYRGSLAFRTDQPGEDPAPFTLDFTVGTPAAPTVEATTGTPVAIEVTGGAAAHEATLALRNAGDATLSYVRLLEPALGRLAAGAARQSLAPAALGRRLAPEAAALDAAEPVAGTAEARRADDPVLGAASFGTAPRLYDIAQLADGQVAVVDGANTTPTTTITVLPRDLSDPGEAFATDAFDEPVTGLAFNTRTGTLWLATFETARLVEVTLDGGQIVPTGRETGLDVTPFGMDYAPALDAFLIGSYASDAVLAVTADGELLPGYPAFVAGREIEGGATSLPGVSVTGGLLEISGAQNQRLQRGQFGAGFDGAVETVFGDAVLSGSSGVYGMLRDRIDPDGSFFVTTRPTDTVPTRLVRLDPPDVAAAVGTRISAGAPLFADRSVEPRAAFDAPLVIDAEGLPAGDVADEIAFLTNNPDAPVVRIPLTLQIRPVAAEDRATGPFSVSAIRPNPARGTAQVAMTLSEGTEVSAAVYDALGRRVAVLADGPLAAGPHTLDVPTAALAPGVYVVRIVAGADVAARKVTVIR